MDFTGSTTLRLMNTLSTNTNIELSTRTSPYVCFWLAFHAITSSDQISKIFHDDFRNIFCCLFQELIQTLSDSKFLWLHNLEALKETIGKIAFLLASDIKRHQEKRFIPCSTMQNEMKLNFSGKKNLNTKENQWKRKLISFAFQGSSEKFKEQIIGKMLWRVSKLVFPPKERWRRRKWKLNRSILQ